jgi:hypothetical protein
MWSSETCMILWRKTPRTFGRGMTLRYSRSEGFWWMRLASRTGRSYRLVAVFSLITVSKQKPVSKKNLAKLYITWIICGPPKHVWFCEGKLLELLGGGMTLRYSRGEEFGWMRLASHTSRSYRLVTVFSLICFLLSSVTPLAKKKLNLFSAYIAYILMYYKPTRFLLHPISPNSIQITLTFPQQRAGNSPSYQYGRIHGTALAKYNKAGPESSISLFYLQNTQR